MLLTVENGVRCRNLLLRHLWYDAKVEQKAGQLLFAVAVFLYSYCDLQINPLDSKGNYSAASNNTKLAHWTLMGHGWAVTFGTARRGLGGAKPAQAPPRCTNITAHPSTASVPVTVLLYDGPLLRSFNAAIKGLNVLINCCMAYIYS